MYARVIPLHLRAGVLADFLTIGEPPQHEAAGKNRNPTNGFSAIV